MFRYLSISDIHLGHTNNTVYEITDNLRKYFLDNHNIFKTLDAIFIVGDVMDKILPNNSSVYIEATEWITELILYCKNNNIRLRILEGTPSHDWQQMKMIYSIIKKLEIDIDFKYINTLYIEKMVDKGINILYIPDEYKATAIETYEDVIALLKENMLEQVDIAMIHGQFTYQIPNVVLKSSHSEELYLNIVKYYISIGHIHTHSSYGRILAQGSFDRLAHGEEEDKGAMVITIDGENSKYVFIPNKRAKLFLTYRYYNTLQEDVIKDLNKKLKGIPIDSYIRVITDDISLVKNVKMLRDRYDTVRIKVEHSKEEEVLSINNQLDMVGKIDSISITRDNIEELLLAELVKYEYTEEYMNIAREELKLVV